MLFCNRVSGRGLPEKLGFDPPNPRAGKGSIESTGTQEVLSFFVFILSMSCLNVNKLELSLSIEITT